MIKVLIISLLSLFILESCSKNEVRINGNWASYSKEFMYTEFYIDDTSIGMFSVVSSNAGRQSYQIIKDSVLYGNGYKTLLRIIDDNTIEFISPSDTMRLKKIADNIRIYNASTMSRRLENGEENFEKFNDSFINRMNIYIHENKLQHLFQTEDYSISRNIIMEEEEIPLLRKTK